uniref:tRNA (adenine(58)-N(1))-methyltransferase n=1 Tax=Anopheles minimus TaxID=112268 RepID=A0A182VQI1_9DIPT
MPILTRGGRICSFSPCIEQSMRVCEALGKCGFIEVQNIEVLQIEDIVRTRNVPVIELDFLKTKRMDTDKDTKTPRESKKYITSSAPNTMAGHTGYLTIAELPPLFARMVQYGNCIQVYFSYIIETINITIVCNNRRDEESLSNGGHRSTLDRPQCPVYTSDVKWPLANLVYLEYDAHRFELSSCVTLNETHSYHGHLLLTNDIETRSYMLPDYLPMWRKKLQQPGMVPFGYGGNCSECNFRNEYVAKMPYHRKNIEKSPSEAQPYCREGGNVSDSITPNSHITMQVNVAMSELMVKLFVPTVVIFGFVVFIRFCLCGRKSSSATVVPEMTSNEKP